MYHAAETLGGAAAMQWVADWLQKLGLGQYAQSFAENDIDFAVLSDLTDQDLENAAGATERRAWHSHGTGYGRMFLFGSPFPATNSADFTGTFGMTMSSSTTASSAAIALPGRSWSGLSCIAEEHAHTADEKRAGVKMGRKPKLSPHQIAEVRNRKAEGESVRFLARSYNVSPNTISRVR
jgi:hypothetical protein